jgi:hypothetical protein
LQQVQCGAIALWCKPTIHYSSIGKTSAGDEQNNGMEKAHCKKAGVQRLLAT